MVRRIGLKGLGKAVLGLGILALGLSSAGAAHADDKLQEVLKRGVLIVGTGSTNPPWEFKDASGNLVGFDIDIARIIAKGLFNDPNKVQFVDQTSDDRVPNVVTDKVDITCQAMTVTAQRAQLVAFTVPYYREGVGLLMLKGANYANYAALKAAGSKVTIAVLQNVYAADMVHEALPQAKVDQYQSFDLIYQAINSHRADAAATDMSSLRWFLKQNPGRYMDGGYAWEPQSYACAVKQGEPDWLQFVNTALLEAMTGVDFPSYKQSFQTWFGQTPPDPSIGFPTEMR